LAVGIGGGKRLVQVVVVAGGSRLVQRIRRRSRQGILIAPATEIMSPQRTVFALWKGSMPSLSPK
jgi:hypothetical protein